MEVLASRIGDMAVPGLEFVLSGAAAGRGRQTGACAGARAACRRCLPGGSRSGDSDAGHWRRQREAAEIYDSG